MLCNDECPFWQTDYEIEDGDLHRSDVGGCRLEFFADWQRNRPCRIPEKRIAKMREVLGEEAR